MVLFVFCDFIFLVVVFTVQYRPRLCRSGRVRAGLIHTTTQTQPSAHTPIGTPLRTHPPYSHRPTPSYPTTSPHRYPHRLTPPPPSVYLFVPTPCTPTDPPLHTHPFTPPSARPFSPPPTPSPAHPFEPPSTPPHPPPLPPSWAPPSLGGDSTRRRGLRHLVLFEMNTPSRNSFNSGSISSSKTNLIPRKPP